MTCARAATEPATIVLAGTDDTKQSFYGAWLTLIYNEAFQRLGLRFQFVGYPAKRAGAMADQGQIDGEIQRVAGYARRHPNLVMIDESHFSMRYSAYAARALPPLNGWASLAGTTYKVEYRSGVNVCETALKPVVPPERLSDIANVPLGLRKLRSSRTDLFIDADLIIQSYLEKDEFKDAGLRKVGDMDNIAFHAYLHKRHAALAPALSKVLHEMKQEGAIERMRLQAASTYR